MRLLIIYGTSYGQTERIARRIAGALTEAGHAVELMKGDALPRDLSLEPYQAFVIGASVIRGRHQRYIRRFVRGHLARLNAAPTAFVSVSMAAAGHTTDDDMRARQDLRRFLDATGWHPTQTAMIGGGLAYRSYGPITRRIMRWMSRRAGQPTDTSRDHELTDWAQVDRFAKDFAAALAPPPSARSAGHTTHGEDAL